MKTKKIASIRIGHYQCQPAWGSFECCLDKLVQMLKEAESQCVEVVCFPECYFCGYYNREPLARKHAFPVDSHKMRRILQATRRLSPTFIVGFNELRRADLYNTAMVAERGRLLGTYSKSTAYMPFHKQGRHFPVFQRGDLTFGVVICSDGGYIEPSRILALKGARVIFAPHSNFLAPQNLINHFQKVRADHTARAVENDIWFVRGNDVVTDKKNPACSYPGVAYGDSYVVDPGGEIVVRSRRHVENLIFADLDLNTPRALGFEQKTRSEWSIQQMGDVAIETARTVRPRPIPPR